METKDCEVSDSKENSKSQVPPTEKKKKKKRRVSVDETASTNEEVEDLKKSKKKRHIIDRESDQFDSVSNPFNVEKEHKRDRKRAGRSAVYLNSSDENYEINHSSISDCDKKRKRKKHEPSELEPTSVQQPDDEVNVQKEKKKRKRDRSVQKDPDAQETGLEIMGKREWKLLRNKYREMQRDKMKEDLKKAIMETESPCSDPANLKVSVYFFTVIMQLCIHLILYF